jgi:hypothetical protein
METAEDSSLRHIPVTKGSIPLISSTPWFGAFIRKTGDSRFKRQVA